MPDYESIEIKTTQRFSRYPIGLFSLSFDGPNIYESNYLLQTYGKLDKKYDKKNLMFNFKYNKAVLYNNYYFKLNINYIYERLEFDIYDVNMNKLETRGYLSFDRLEKRINSKIINLALINASKKKINENLYFRYYKISCYRFKNFETFLNLIKSGTIEISLMLRFSKSLDELGKNKNKNMFFKIKKDEINKLYDELYSYGL